MDAWVFFISILPFGTVCLHVCFGHVVPSLDKNKSANPVMTIIYTSPTRLALKTMWGHLVDGVTLKLSLPIKRAVG